MQTPIRPTIPAEGGESAGITFSFQKATDTRSSARRPTGYSPDQERRVSQREKQVSFGYATEGYRNMIKLVEHDPLLKSGGILPLPPPDVNKGSKRTWDVLLRKWRRALHMFDCVFIEGEDEEPKTLDDVMEEQRLEWVSSTFIHESKENRVRISAERIREARGSPYVPTKLPVEDSLKIVLRSKDCYEPVSNVVPVSASSLIKGSDISHLDAGIKIFVAPSSQSSQMLLTPGKPGTISAQETPQHHNYSVSTPAQVNRSASSMRTLPAPYPSCPSRPSDNAPVWVAPQFLTRPPKHDSPCSVNHHHHHHNNTLPMSAGKCPQPMSPRWDQLFSHPVYAPSNLHNSALSVGVGRKRTPATAPRRVTFLQSKRKEESFGTVEILQRNLFPNNTTTPENPDNKVKKIHSFASPRETLAKDVTTIEVTEQPAIHSVAQRLFPEQ